MSECFVNIFDNEHWYLHKNNGLKQLKNSNLFTKFYRLKLLSKGIHEIKSLFCVILTYKFVILV